MTLTIKNINQLCKWQLRKEHEATITFKKVYSNDNAYTIKCLRDAGWAGLLSDAQNFKEIDLTINRHTKKVKFGSLWLAVELVSITGFLYSLGNAVFGSASGFVYELK